MTMRPIAVASNLVYQAQITGTSNGLITIFQNGLNASNVIYQAQITHDIQRMRYDRISRFKFN